MTGALVLSGGLLADDVTGIGVADDVVIPFILVGGALAAAVVSGWNALSESESGGKKTVPGSTGPPGGYVEGPRRGREYGPDGKPVRDYDKPHQGYDRPHVHEWPGGKREHPGRDYSPWPPE
ncbi:hypothetical protein [Microbulbifer variabilis]|uniref:hypothetical protein n=1 Tax=Microbulbifer variabilis TaxID=266805 RepID=UPI001CFF3940|nr:hypothetical protein [Microbulbifer variabilis]